MKICFVGFFSPGRISGPSESVINLSKCLAALGESVSVVTSCRKTSEIFYISGVPVLPLNSIRWCLRECDVAVLCGVYDFQIYRISCIARRERKPYVISARGNLTLGSQNKSRLKKIIYRFLFVNSMLGNASAVHFLTDDEQSASLMLNSESFVVPNGVDSPDIDYPSQRGPQYEKTIVFLGRLDIFHKGIDNLLDAIRIVGPNLSSEGWRFEFYGPDHSVQDRQWIRHFIEMNGVSDLVFLNGPVHGINKFKALSRGRFFIHTSRYEGQPQSVLQAMATGSIPILTDGCNLSTLNKERNFAIEVDECPDSIARGIETAVRMSLDERELLSQTNANVVAECFDWENVSMRFLDKISRIVKLK